ncbi:MAG: HAMP domain-containing histidine kinase [Cytophagales bacterium]|jgi:two-component system phosphate regulon sensor histidine kinase PhoR|nr:HAMP domain-containing histidine kinase [Cytophagales bacterium]
MKRRTFRLIIVLATLSVFGIVVVQVFWFRQAFGVREVEFDRTARVALTSVAEAILRYNQHPSPSAVTVRRLSSSDYVAMVNDVIDETLLKTLLRNEFEKQNIRVDFQYIIYDCANNEAVYGNYFVFGKEDADVQKATAQAFPRVGDNYYFGVRFVNKDLALVGQMRFWIFSSGVLLLVVAFFGYTSFVVFRQKRLAEIQQDFINNMTHEFKTPLSTIAISSEVLKDPAITKSPERLLNYATIIGQEAGRLKSQVERVLQMASLEDDELKLKHEPADLHELIGRAAEPFRLPLAERGGKLSLDLQAENPHASVDKLHLTNVLYNLLDNAIKYNRNVPEITVATRNEKNTVCVTVSDNGIGIEPEHQKRVFDRFYRVPTGNLHDVKGFGLGLNYVRLIAKAHGGSAKVESTPGQGSRFTVSILNE